MDCNEFSNLLDAFLDDALPDADARRFQDHARACPGCAALLAQMKDCRRLDEDIEVPESFSASWRQAIREDREMKNNGKTGAGRFRSWKTWAAAAAALLFLVGGTALSRDSFPRVRSADAQSRGADAVAYTVSSAKSLGAAPRAADAGTANFAYADMERPEPMEDYAMSAMEDYAMPAEEADEGAVQAAGQVEKVIRSASFTVKTTAYDEDLARLQTLTEEMGGRVEYLSASGDASSGQTRRASLTLRIPALRLDDFLSGAQGVGTVTDMTQERQDISDSYYDIQTRLETQRAKLARLQAMMSAAEDVSDLIEIESAVADAQYWIDRYTQQIRGYDSRVDFSTVSVSVREVRKTEVQTLSLGQRIWTAMEDSLEEFGWFLEDMVIFLAAALPWLLPLAAVIAVIAFAVRRHRKRKKQTENQ